MASKKALSNMAAQATASMFSATPDPKQKETKPAAKPKQAAKKEPKAAAVPTADPEKAEKKVFSCRLDENHAAQWQAYIDAVDGKAGDLTDRAIMEYMNRHKLNADQQTVYSLKMKLYESKRVNK